MPSPHAAQSSLSRDVSIPPSTRMRASHRPQWHHISRLWPRVRVDPRYNLHWGASSISLRSGLILAYLFDLQIRPTLLVDVVIAMVARTTILRTVSFLLYCCDFSYYGASLRLAPVLCSSRLGVFSLFVYLEALNISRCLYARSAALRTTELYLHTCDMQYRPRYRGFVFRNMPRCLGLGRRYLDWFERLLYLFVEPTPVIGPPPLLFANPSILSHRNDPRSTLHDDGALG